MLGFTDANSELHGHVLCGVPVIGNDGVLRRYRKDEILLANGMGGLGDETIPARQRLQQSLEKQGWHFCKVIHPRAIVSNFAQLGDAVQVMAGCVIQARASLGEGCIVNTSAVIEHDVCIGVWCHIAPRAVVCGQTRIGRGSHVGAGATVRQGLFIGDHTLVGAGAVVVKDFAEGGRLVGVPARMMEAKQ